MTFKGLTLSPRYGLINIGMGNVDIVDAAMLARIGQTVAETLIDFPHAFRAEKRNIIWEMYEAKPEKYKNDVFGDKLEWSEWPGNESEVNFLALKVAGGEGLKEVLRAIVDETVGDEINSKLNEIPVPPARIAAKKAVDKLIDKAIDEAVDKALKELRKQIEDAAESFKESFEEGMGKPDTNNPILAKKK